MKNTFSNNIFHTNNNYTRSAPFQLPLFQLASGNSHSSDFSFSNHVRIECEWCMHFAKVCSIVKFRCCFGSRNVGRVCTSTHRHARIISGPVSLSIKWKISTQHITILTKTGDWKSVSEWLWFEACSNLSMKKN